MGKSKKFYKRFTDFDWKNSLCFGPNYVRCLVFTSMILLLLYSLVFHNFIIILVILMQAMALLATFI